VVEDGEASADQISGRCLPDRGKAFLVPGTLGRVGELLRRLCRDLDQSVDGLRVAVDYVDRDESSNKGGPRDDGKK
jgi:hypothetical protein